MNHSVHPIDFPFYCQTITFVLRRATAGAPPSPPPLFAGPDKTTAAPPGSGERHCTKFESLPSANATCELVSRNLRVKILSCAALRRPPPLTLPLPCCASLSSLGSLGAFRGDQAPPMCHTLRDSTMRTEICFLHILGVAVQCSGGSRAVASTAGTAKCRAGRVRLERC